MRKKSILLFILSLTILSTSAQSWGGGIDDNNLHFGFTFQYLSSEYKVLKKSNWQDPYFYRENLSATEIQITNSLTAIYSEPSPGFGIGFVVNSRLNDKIDVRFTPTLTFTERRLYYEYIERSKIDMPFSLKKQKVQSNMVEFPLGLKFKSDRRNNYRAYILGGGKYSINIKSDKESNSTTLAPLETLLKNRKSFFSYEAGVGLDVYFEYFKMSPEIKLSYSANSILKSEENAYSAPLDKLMLRYVSFSLFFE